MRVHGAAVLVVLAGLVSPALAVGTGNDARVRVVHASPDAPAVDVVVNDAITAFADVEFGEITEYASLPASEYNFKVVPAGMMAPVVIDADANLFYNTDYTVVAIDTLDEIRPLVLVDRNRPVSVTKASIRFVHASPDAPAVDIAVTGGPVLFSGVAFGEFGDYVTVPAGTYDLEVRLAGTNTVVLPLPGIRVQGGTTYTAYAVGFASGSPSLTAILSEDFVNKARDRRGNGMAAEDEIEQDAPAGGDSRGLGRR